MLKFYYLGVFYKNIGYGKYVLYGKIKKNIKNLLIGNFFFFLLIWIIKYLNCRVLVFKFNMKFDFCLILFLRKYF